MMIDQCIYDGIIIEIVGAMSDQDRIIVVRSHYVIAELYNSVYTSEYPLSVSASVIASYALIDHHGVVPEKYCTMGPRSYTCTWLKDWI
jgi:hypothetical protein